MTELFHEVYKMSEITDHSWTHGLMDTHCNFLRYKRAMIAKQSSEKTHSLF